MVSSMMRSSHYNLLISGSLLASCFHSRNPHQSAHVCREAKNPSDLESLLKDFAALRKRIERAAMRVGTMTRVLNQTASPASSHLDQPTPIAEESHAAPLEFRDDGVTFFNDVTASVDQDTKVLLCLCSHCCFAECVFCRLQWMLMMHLLI
jgi:hypothetical protein